MIIKQRGRDRSIRRNMARRWRRVSVPHHLKFTGRSKTEIDREERQDIVCRRAPSVG
jgi:hypothetical protein